MYDFLIVGAGLFGATFAQQALASGKKVLIIDKRPHVAGNAFTRRVQDIDIHEYGAHIFHTNHREVWGYVNSFGEFNNFINSPVAISKGKVFSLPFNMNTFSQLWGPITPEEAKLKIRQQVECVPVVPANLKEQAIKLVGTDIYDMLIKEYTEKQWGRSCEDLPPSIIKRIPLRFTFDNNYFDSSFQGVPLKGYTHLVENMIDGADVKLCSDYFEDKAGYDSLAKCVVYTGPIDRYFDYCFGPLEYRTVSFTHEMHFCSNVQGNAVVNHVDKDVPWTRTIEHKWFTWDMRKEDESPIFSIVSREQSEEWSIGAEPYYPINDEKNTLTYQKYRELAEQEKDVVFGGRLAEYKYYDMDIVIMRALKAASERLHNV